MLETSIPAVVPAVPWTMATTVQLPAAVRPVRVFPSTRAPGALVIRVKGRFRVFWLPSVMVTVAETGVPAGIWRSVPGPTGVPPTVASSWRARLEGAPPRMTKSADAVAPPTVAVAVRVPVPMVVRPVRSAVAMPSASVVAVTGGTPPAGPPAPKVVAKVISSPERSTPGSRAVACTVAWRVPVSASTTGEPRVSLRCWAAGGLAVMVTLVGWLTFPAASVAVRVKTLSEPTESGTAIRHLALKGSAVVVNGPSLLSAAVNAGDRVTVRVLPYSAVPVRTWVGIIVGVVTGSRRGAGGGVVSFCWQPAPATASAARTARGVRRRRTVGLMRWFLLEG